MADKGNGHIKTSLGSQDFTITLERNQIVFQRQIMHYLQNEDRTKKGKVQ